MTKCLSDRMTEIPLYILPQAVARLIRKKGGAVYRISVVRTHWHHYNVTVRTKGIRKEKRPARVAVVDPVGDIAGRNAAGEITI